jgi:hypothetical protein
MTPEQRSLRSRLGGLTTAARGHVNTAAARAAFAERFYRDIPTDLPQAERDRRAAAARRLHMAQLAFRSSRARSNEKAGPDCDFGPAQEARHGPAIPTTD